MTRDDEDTVRVRRDSVSLGARRASSVFPTPDAIHAEADAFASEWSEREAALRRENERLRAQRDSYRDAVHSMQELVEKRDAENRILKKALGR